MNLNIFCRRFLKSNILQFQLDRSTYFFTQDFSHVYKVYLKRFCYIETIDMLFCFPSKSCNFILIVINTIRVNFPKSWKNKQMFC